MRGVARTTRTVPAYRGGPEVSELAYRIVLYGQGRRCKGQAVELAVGDEVTVLEVVETLVDVLAVDEADVLRALAELEAVGVLYTGKGIA
jgi:hypothetical protein